MSDQKKNHSSRAATPDHPAIRYGRQIILPGVGNEGQQRLREARVLVIGMGGLGSPVALYLAAAGVGTLGLADMDEVDLSNLHRQILHDNASIGRPKIDSASERLLGLNPAVKLVPFKDGIRVDNAREIFSQFDVIVDGSDNFPTRYLNNDAAFLTGKALVYGSIFQFEGQVSVFAPTRGGPCYRCLFPRLPEEGSVPNCAEAGVLPSLCGIVGSWQASEAIKLILGIGSPLIGRLKVLDILSGRDRLVAIKPDPSCPLCGKDPSLHDLREENYQMSCTMPESESETNALPAEIRFEEAAEALQAAQPPLLLDVRQEEENAYCSLSGSVLIPLNELPQRWQDLPADRDIVVYCHHGMRSLRAVQFLRERGLARSRSLAGGIDAWSRFVDPGVPRY